MSQDTANAAENNLDTDANEPAIPNPAGSAAKDQQVNYEEEIAKYKDNWLRSVAEVDNIKRRAKQDIEKATFFSIENFAKDLISVLDFLYSTSEAVNAPNTNADPQWANNVKEAIELTKKEMLQVFERNHIKRLDPVNEKFDHNFHQAIAQIDSELESGTIVNVVQAGYTIRDRLLRPAMVAVAKKV